MSELSPKGASSSMRGGRTYKGSSESSVSKSNEESEGKERDPVRPVPPKGGGAEVSSPIRPQHRINKSADINIDTAPPESAERLTLSPLQHAHGSMDPLITGKTSQASPSRGGGMAMTPIRNAKAAVEEGKGSPREYTSKGTSGSLGPISITPGAHMRRDSGEGSLSPLSHGKGDSGEFKQSSVVSSVGAGFRSDSAMPSLKDRRMTPDKLSPVHFAGELSTSPVLSPIHGGGSTSGTGGVGGRAGSALPSSPISKTKLPSSLIVDRERDSTGDEEKSSLSPPNKNRNNTALPKVDAVFFAPIAGEDGESHTHKGGSKQQHRVSGSSVLQTPLETLSTPSKQPVSPVSLKKDKSGGSEREGRERASLSVKTGDISEGKRSDSSFSPLPTSPINMSSPGSSLDPMMSPPKEGAGGGGGRNPRTFQVVQKH